MALREPSFTPWRSNLKSLLLAAWLAATLPPGTAAPPDASPAADPHAPVPRMAYRSAFRDTPAGVEPEAIDWKKANAEVGRFPRGHIDLLRWEERQGLEPGPAARPPSVQSAPQPKAATPTAPPGHRH